MRPWMRPQVHPQMDPRRHLDEAENEGGRERQEAVRFHLACVVYWGLA